MRLYRRSNRRKEVADRFVAGTVPTDQQPPYVGCYDVKIQQLLPHYPIKAPRVQTHVGVTNDRRQIWAGHVGDDCPVEEISCTFNAICSTTLAGECEFKCVAVICDAADERRRSLHSIHDSPPIVDAGAEVLSAA